MLSREQALSIISEARAAGMEVAHSDTVDHQISVAQEILDEAVEAHSKGAKGQSIKTIMLIGNPLTDILEEAEKVETHLNLPTPKDYGDEPPDFPRDISVLSDRKLRTLHAEFTAMLTRANWLLAIEETDEITARQLADLHYAKAISKAAGVPDTVTGKAKTEKRLEAEAAGDDEVRKWRGKQNEHFVQVKLLKALRDNYQMICERISREWTMRQIEQTSQVS